MIYKVGRHIYPWILVLSSKQRKARFFRSCSCGHCLTCTSLAPAHHRHSVVSDTYDCCAEALFAFCYCITAWLTELFPGGGEGAIIAWLIEQLFLEGGRGRGANWNTLTKPLTSCMKRHDRIGEA